MFGINIPSSVSKLSKDFDGYIFISDIDKTYLATQIDSIGGLIKAALEGPEQKANVPGFAILLRALRRGAATEAQCNPIFFVSASPPQMRQKLLAKMEIDGVQHEGIILKDQLQHVRHAEFRKLTEQIGYKLPALLTLWPRLPQGAKLVLFGDDSESDATIFSLFSEILAKTISPRKITSLLLYLGVARKEAVLIAWKARSIKQKSYPVQAVFINLITATQPEYYKKLAPYFYATENALQASLVFWEKGLLRSRAIRSIARDLVINHEKSPEELLESLEAGAKLGYYSRDSLSALWPMLADAGWLPPSPDHGNFEGGDVEPPINSKWNHETRATMSLAELKFRYTDEARY